MEASGLFHFDDGTQIDGPGPERADYETFLSFSDPDGNGWLVQEVPSRADEPGPRAAAGQVRAKSSTATTSAAGWGGPSASTQRTSM